MLEAEALRKQFPALQHSRNGRVPIFFDGPAGTQVPEQCIGAMVKYLSTCNANCGGAFAGSIESDQILRRAHEGMADFLHAPSPEEIVFGSNMTTLTFHLSRAIGRILQPGDEVVVTRLDHDANVRPWIFAAEEAGATVRWVDIHPEDCTLDMDHLTRQLTDNTKLVAVTAASNLAGSIVDVAKVAASAHQGGAWCFVDAVHFAPHGTIDVQKWNCDFLVCSAYKFFGPHIGVLWGKLHLLEELTHYKLRPASRQLPGSWMTGTQNHEGLAGVTGTLDYLRDIGKNKALTLADEPGESLSRLRLRSAMTAIRRYEQQLAARLLQALHNRPHIKIWGIADVQRLDERVPTVSITHANKSPQELAERLAAQHIYAWSGNNYAVELTERLGLEDKGGVLRIGLVHYNTEEEIDTLMNALDKP